MKRDAFSQCHPAVNFLFFLEAIGFAVVIQHPAYLAAAIVGAAVYYLLLHGRKGLKSMLTMAPLMVLIAGINPLFNLYGKTVLFSVFGRPYTLEALYFGAALAGMFAAMMLWFGCYNAVLTSDKFLALFGSRIPSLSLLLVMVLRMIPNLMKKTGQIIGARRSVGKGASEQSPCREKIHDGMTVMSALTDWALEGSVITADSMRARGYGCTRRTTFQIYRMTARDVVLLVLIAVLGGCVIGCGGTAATFTPDLYIPPVSWGFFAYCLFLLIPTALQLKEAIIWRILISGI